MKMKYLTILLAIFIFFTGCAKTENPENESGSNITEEEIKKKESLSIETNAGVVIVGSIQKDDNGWYFVPEQPLDIKLTYYEENPEVFNHVTRFEMLESGEDGFDKILYEKQLVTITGQISNPRGAGILYLIPYKIEVGKMVEKSYGDSSIAMPEKEEVSYHPELLSEKMKPIIEENRYLYNPYVLSEEALKEFGNEFADFYLEVIDAYLNYKTTVSCPSKDYADYLTTVLYYEFPMFQVDASYSSYDWYDKENHTITWKYTKTKEEHQKIIDEVTTSANLFLKGIEASDSELQKALKLYSNFNQDMKYDYDAMETRENIDAYYAYTNHSGVCVTFAIAYSQLLSQVGIESTLASGTVSNGEGHVWNVVTIDQKHYFVDSTYQITSQKSSYHYFGMNLEKRLNDGSGFKENDIWMGKYQVKGVDEISIANTSLELNETSES